jgi:hypothetical protein
LSGFGPLLNVVREERGPSPSFTSAHVVLAFLVIGDSSAIGRQALARKAGLGDGSVRTVLKKLRDAGYVDVTPSGCLLTKPGRQIYVKMRERLSRVVLVERSPLTVGSKQAAIRVKGSASLVQSGIEQRDSAIKVGALGATTYVISGSRFTVPGGSSDCEGDFPSPVWDNLRRELSPRDGDAIVIGGSTDYMKSQLGAIAAALTLL